MFPLASFIMCGLKIPQILNLNILKTVINIEEHSVWLHFDSLCVVGLFMFYFLCFKNKPHQTAVILACSHDSGSWGSMRNCSAERSHVLCSAQKGWTFWAAIILGAAPLGSLNSGQCVQTNCLLFLHGRDKYEKNKTHFIKTVKKTLRHIKVENGQSNLVSSRTYMWNRESNTFS